MPQSLLNIVDLQVRLPRKQGYVNAVDGIGFSITQGEIFCLVGESGSGKTVTAHSVMRLLEEAEYGEESEINVDETDILNLSDVALRTIRGKKIAIIFQEPMTSLNPVLPIGQQIAEVLKLHGSHSNIKKRCLELLQDVGIGDPNHVLQIYPHQLSGGMRQRVMIAIALAGEPDILIADEPTTALDVTIQAQVLSLIQKLGKARDMAVLLITHDLAIVSNIADTVAVMHHGKIVEIAPRDDFFRQPQHAYSQKLLNCTAELSLRGASGQFSSLRGGTPPKQSSPILTVNHLSVYYPIKKGLLKRTAGYIKAVDDISFSLQKGQTLALVGESGCGKSSTAFALLRLLDCAKGEIIFHGENLLALGSRALTKLRRYIQMIFQDPLGSLNPRMTVRDILSEGWDAQKLFYLPEKREIKLIELMHSVGLDPEGLSRYPHEFSGGQHQRIAIARALAMQPQIIVCDEPTSALDVSIQSQIIHLLKKLQDEQQLSYIFISHNIPVVSYLAHYIAVMYLGKIVEYGPSDEIIRSPKHPYTQALLAAVPKITPEPTPFNSPQGEIPSPAHPPSGCHFHPRCPFAMPQCKIEYPPITQLSENHQVRCYLYGQDEK